MRLVTCSSLKSLLSQTCSWAALIAPRLIFVLSKRLNKRAHGSRLNFETAALPGCGSVTLRLVKKLSGITICGVFGCHFQLKTVTGVGSIFIDHWEVRRFCWTQVI